MNGRHRTSSIQRPITGEVTRPTRRRRRPAADGTPGRGLPERPLPGRPAGVLRSPTTATRRPAATTARPTPRTRNAPSTGRAVRAATPSAASTRPGSSRPVSSRPPSGRQAAGRTAAAATSTAGTTRRLSPVPEVPLSGRTPRSRAAGQAATTRAGGLGRFRRRRPAAADDTKSKRSPLRDVTRPIARDSRMTERRPVRIGYGLIAAAISLALVAALVVLPIRRWWDQRAELSDRRRELQILQEANAQISSDVAALNTPEGIQEEARKSLNYAFPGEDRTRSVGDAQAPFVLPGGFPYTLVSGILASRINLAAAPVGPDVTTGPTTPADAAAGTTADASAPPADTEPPTPTIAPPPGNPLAP